MTSDPHLADGIAYTLEKAVHHRVTQRCDAAHHRRKWRGRGAGRHPLPPPPGLRSGVGTLSRTERVKESGDGWIRAAEFSLAPLCGERVGVRGLLLVDEDMLALERPFPLTRNPRASAQIPTSPRKRGEVIGLAANSFTAALRERGDPARRAGWGRVASSPS
jgi:hypothetical protein